MSTHLLCEDCQEYLWVGQSNWIYKTQVALELLGDFLEEHRMHTLRYGSELGFTGALGEVHPTNFERKKNEKRKEK